MMKIIWLLVLFFLEGSCVGAMIAPPMPPPPPPPPPNPNKRPAPTSSDNDDDDEDDGDDKRKCRACGYYSYLRKGEVLKKGMCQVLNVMGSHKTTANICCFEFPKYFPHFLDCVLRPSFI